MMCYFIIESRLIIILMYLPPTSHVTSGCDLKLLFGRPGAFGQGLKDFSDFASLLEEKLRVYYLHD